MIDGWPMTRSVSDLVVAARARANVTLRQLLLSEIGQAIDAQYRNSGDVMTEEQIVALMQAYLCVYAEHTHQPSEAPHDDPD